LDSDEDSLFGDDGGTWTTAAARAGRMRPRQAAAFGSNPPPRWRAWIPALRRPSWSAAVDYWASLPLRRQARLTSIASVLVASALFAVALSILLATYARSLRQPVVKVSLEPAATLDLPAVSFCSSFRDVPAFAHLPTERYPGHPIFTAHAFVNWEDGTQQAYPEAITSGWVETTTIGTAAAPYATCDDRLSKMSIRRMQLSYDGYNGLKPLPGIDPANDPRCTACVRIGVSPKSGPLSLSANRRAAGKPVGVSVSLTTSDAFQYCVDGRLRRNDVTGYIYPFVLQVLARVIVEHVPGLIEKKVLDFAGHEPKRISEWSGEYTWFSLAEQASDEDYGRMVSMHCNVYFFSGYFYPSDDPPGSVAYRLDVTGFNSTDPFNRTGHVVWTELSTGSSLPLFHTGGFAEPFDNLPSMAVNAPLENMPPVPGVGRPPPPIVGVDVSAKMVDDGGANGGGTAPGGDDGSGRGGNSTAVVPASATEAVLDERRAITDAVQFQFSSRSALHLSLFTQSPAEAAAGPPAADRQIALVGQTERYVRLELARSIDFDGVQRYLPERLAVSELSRARISGFESTIFSEWLFDVSYSSFVTTVNSLVAGVTPAQVAADAANYLGACTGASMFTFLIVPLNLGVAGALRYGRRRRPVGTG